MKCEKFYFSFQRSFEPNMEITAPAKRDFIPDLLQQRDNLAKHQSIRNKKFYLYFQKKLLFLIFLLLYLFKNTKIKWP